jgi:hypothetical protein
MHIYDYIESVTRVHLLELRKENEANRAKLFKKAFVDEGDAATKKIARGDYVEALLYAIEKECESYRPAQDEVLSTLKVNSRIWDASMEEILPSGEPFISRAFKISLSSPFAFEGMNKEEVRKMYQESLNFGINHLLNQNN